MCRSGYNYPPSCPRSCEYQLCRIQGPWKPKGAQGQNSTEAQNRKGKRACVHPFKQNVSLRGGMNPWEGGREELWPPGTFLRSTLAIPSFVASCFSPGLTQRSQRHGVSTVLDPVFLSYTADPPDRTKCCRDGLAPHCCEERATSVCTQQRGSGGDFGAWGGAGWGWVGGEGAGWGEGWAGTALL